MSQLAIKDERGFRIIDWPSYDLGQWLYDNAHPADGNITLDFEASGLHVDGNWATDAAKCEPEARVSTVAMSWDDTYNNARVSVAIPFDQGWVGGKKGKYVKSAPKRPKHPETCPAFGLREGRKLAGREACEEVGCRCFDVGWQILPHTRQCAEYNGAPHNDPSTINAHGCVCAPWNFGVEAWDQLCGWWSGTMAHSYGEDASRCDDINRYNSAVETIDYFNAKYDMWIALAGLRDGAHIKCFDDCQGWKHARLCPNSGVDLSAKLGNDAMIFEAIRIPDEKISLDAVSRRLFGRGKDEGMEEGLKANGPGLLKRYDLVDWPTTAKYAAMDTELTREVKRRHRNMIEAGEIDYRDFPIIEREHRKAVLLFKMEQRGVGFDVDLCREQGTKMHAEVDKLIDELPFPANSGAASRYFFGPVTEADEFESLGLLPVKLTDGGAPACDQETVAKLKKEPGVAGTVAKLWEHIANMQSVCAKWYDAWPHRAGKDGRLRTVFYQFATADTTRAGNKGGAISGRLSASRIQLQGVPQAWRIPDGIVGIKKLFRPKPKHQLWSFDASNAEVRVTAWLCKCAALADVINSGVNIHSANTVNIFGEMLSLTWEQHTGLPWPSDQPFNSFESAEIEGGWTTDASKARIDDDGDPVYVLSKHPDWKKVRTSMKRGIFGTIYASGVLTLKTQIDNDLKDDIPVKQIKGFMDALRAAYPEIGRTARACEEKATYAKFVRLVSGRRRVFGWGEETYKALNACVQGGVAEMMSALMLAIEDRWPGMLVNQVHDDVWLEIPDELADEVVPWVKAEGKRIFETAFRNPGMPITFKFDGKRLA